jgi:galactokinase
VPIASGISVVICDTRAERNLVGSEYDSRRAQCEEGVRILQEFYPGIEALRDVSLEQFEAHRAELPDVVAKRCRFIIEENQRVLELAQALPAGDYDRLQALFAASYSGARDLYEIGASAMAMMIDAMRSGPGVIGARQAGAGFGGCMVALVQRDQVEAFGNHVQQTYATAAGIEPRVYEVMPSAGAGTLEDRTTPA